MAKIALKNGYFSRFEGDSRNYLVVDEEGWRSLDNLPEGTEVWILGCEAVVLINEVPSVFYGLINRGKLDSYLIRPNDRSYKGVYAVRLNQVTEHGLKEFERKAKKTLPALKNKLRKAGVEESLIQATVEQIEAATNKATQQLREGLEVLIREKGMTSETATV